MIRSIPSLSEDPDNPAVVRGERAEWPGEDPLIVELRDGGGFVARFTPAEAGS